MSIWLWIVMSFMKFWWIGHINTDCMVTPLRWTYTFSLNTAFGASLDGRIFIRVLDDSRTWDFPPTRARWKKWKTLQKSYKNSYGSKPLWCQKVFLRNLGGPYSLWMFPMLVVCRVALNMDKITITIGKRCRVLI
jgi:hypothetical protein